MYTEFPYCHVCARPPTHGRPGNKARCKHNICYETVCTGPHRGVPNRLAAQNNRTGIISPGNVLSLYKANEEYQATGGSLSPPFTFGIDPLSLSPNLCAQRTLALDTNIPSPEDLFAYTVNGYYQPFMYSLRFFIDVTHQLSAFM